MEHCSTMCVHYTMCGRAAKVWGVAGCILPVHSPALYKWSLDTHIYTLPLPTTKSTKWCAVALNWEMNQIFRIFVVMQSVTKMTMCWLCTETGAWLVRFSAPEWFVEPHNWGPGRHHSLDLEHPLAKTIQFIWQNKHYAAWVRRKAKYKA